MNLDEILKRISLLNDTILDSMEEKTDKDIVKKFINAGIEILGADFGFSWWKFSDQEDYKLAYKTPTTPYEPFPPREKGGHYMALKTKKSIYDSDVKKENYGLSDISPFMKSFIIIPMYYKDYVYGALTICYKKKHIFTKDELVLSDTLGSSTAQAITIHRSRQRSVALKETQILLSQEQLKTEFIQNATHELRTPLAIMKGNVDLALIQGTKDESVKEVLEIVNGEIKHLSNIIEDLSILTSQGKTSNETILSSKVDLSELINNTVKRLRTLAKEKNIALKLKDGDNFTVNGDEKYLEKLFLNLIKNAINYGKNGGEILVETKKTKDVVEIKIIDDGIGIKPEELPKIFERFYRTEDARELKKKGIGLGLAIAQWVTKIHGGTMNVQSKYGKGTTFTVELPLAKE